MCINKSHSCDRSLLTFIPGIIHAFYWLRCYQLWIPMTHTRSTPLRGILLHDTSAQQVGQNEPVTPKWILGQITRSFRYQQMQVLNVMRQCLGVGFPILYHKSATWINAFSLRRIPLLPFGMRYKSPLVIFQSLWHPSRHPGHLTRFSKNGAGSNIKLKLESFGYLLRFASDGIQIQKMKNKYT